MIPEVENSLTEQLHVLPSGQRKEEGTHMNSTTGDLFVHRSEQVFHIPVSDRVQNMTTLTPKCKDGMLFTTPGGLWHCSW